MFLHNIMNNKNNETCIARLLCAKTRVTPLEALSIQRFQLNGD